MDFKNEITELVANAAHLDKEELYKAIEAPPDSKMGDFAFPCFRLAKELKKAPNVIAAELKDKLVMPEFVCEIRVTGPYLNFFLDRALFSKIVLKNVFEEGESYGSSDMGKNGCVVIDYSSPNIAKPFHIGHLRSTVIGNAIYHIYNFLGYKSFGINYLGDWGTQFGKVIAAYKHWGNKDAVNEGGIMEVNRLYIKFHEAAEKNSALEDEARGWLVKMQEGDEDALALWKWFSDISMIEYDRIYSRLNVSFDSYKGESFYNDKMAPIVEELKQKDLLVESDGAMIVDLEEYKMPPCLILRRDGGTLYPTRDIASVMYRKNEYHFVKAIYITGMDQTLHFNQWFKVVELMGYEWAKDLIYVPFGLVNFEGGKLSTRKGNVLLMEALLDEAVSRSKEIIEEKSPQLEEKETVAQQVGIGAVIFNDLYNSRIKDVDFSWDKMLNFEGETGPYVQYTHARCASVLTKAGEIDFSDADLSNLNDDASFELIKILYYYPEKIVEAANKLEPFVISRHLMSIAQAFNKFYHDNSILSAEEEIKKARLYLTKCVKDVVFGGLRLIGIQAPDKM